MTDVLGQAIYDYHFRLTPSKLLVHNQFGLPDEMPVETYFRDEEDMPPLELNALDICRGMVLDIGAGAGSHALYLQQNNIQVTALDISPLACTIMKNRGVEKIITADINKYTGQQFDTLLLLMNGIGLTANINGLHIFLRHIKTLLASGGQLVFDSSNVAYLYKKGIRPVRKYYGEIDFRYEYKKQKTNWFTWLYVDQQMLQKIAGEEGWKTEIIFEDDHDQYLARLTLK
ncbi:MAG: class I SAM-dependent methyltransferase [Chitinophagaceae bacterium]|nr:class I SAM-dependent methyltransferase [Chitinophagaceae bacterium]